MNRQSKLYLRMQLLTHTSAYTSLVYGLQPAHPTSCGRQIVGCVCALGIVSNHVFTLTHDCRTIYLEPLSLEEQIRVFASSQIVLMTHGAALVHTLFMAPVRYVSHSHVIQF